MMKPTRPNISKGSTYPLEFREEAVRYWLSSGQTLAAVSSNLGVSPECLRSWRKQMETTPHSTVKSDDVSASGVQTSNELALARELGQVRRELDAMTRQRDILKKAISIFSEDKTMGGGLK